MPATFERIERRFPIREGEPMGTQIVRLAGVLAVQMQDPELREAKIREIVVVLERKVE